LVRSDDRVAEGAPLLREYGVYSLIEGSNPSCSANIKPQVIDLLGVFLFPGFAFRLYPSIHPSSAK
jgi:hypothetical protein